MGKKCAICGREAGAMDRKKLDNGEVICSWCVEAISFSEGFNKTRFKQSSVDELKERISKCVYDREYHYSGAFGAASAILTSVKLEDIGTLI